MPRSGDTYLHRIGRTARAGRKGTAISLVEAHDHLLLDKVGRYIEDVYKRQSTPCPASTTSSAPSQAYRTLPYPTTHSVAAAEMCIRDRIWPAIPGRRQG